eukprot:CAMPEP_0115218564 /NCGR_PEP_ID=MMETSP0270-20121206/26459_1 /TAXON_ID=71861 /ORGANISM="Scrippsiella trochoidea, Strain CCMP3099" /LENGTH=219 /DNA_ID=CAMNT_0002632517 /DNA_START=60 /DNA_END=719 /DNA_ORIENTATION=-
MCFFDLDELEEAERRASEKAAAFAEPLPATLAPVAASTEKADLPAPAAFAEPLPAALALVAASGDKAEGPAPNSEEIEVKCTPVQPLQVAPLPVMASGERALPPSQEAPAPKSEPPEVKSLIVEPLPALLAASEQKAPSPCSDVLASKSAPERSPANLSTSASDASNNPNADDTREQFRPSSSAGRLASKVGTGACFELASCGLWRMVFRPPVGQLRKA